MLHPSLLKLLQNETSSDLLFREDLAQVWQKISTHYYSYERDIKILEHASDIANEDYERINQQLKESNKGLGLELSQKLNELSLLSQFPLVNPNPVLRTDAEGNIEYINNVASRLNQIVYNNKEYSLSDFLKSIVSQVKETGRFEVQEGDQYFLFSYQRFENGTKINFYGVNITEQVQTRKRAYENFYRLSNFIESTQAVHYIIYKNQTENNFFTSRWPLIFGFNPTKVNDPLLEKQNAVLISSYNEYEKSLQQLEETGYVKFKYQVQNKITQKKIWVEEEIRKKFDPYLNDEVITGKIEDITANELLKETVQESESRFRQITEVMPVMIWTSDTKNIVNYSNQRTKDFFGKGLEEFDGPDEFISLVHPDSKIKTGEEWLKGLLEQKEVEQEYLLKGIDGKYHYVLEKAIPRFLPSGEFVGYIGAFFDLTKEYEYQQELQKEKQQLELIANNSNDIVLLTDKNGTISYASPASKRILGFTPAEMLGKCIYDYFCTTCREMVVPNIRQNSFTSPEPETYTFRLVADTGEEIWTESLISLIHNSTGEKNLLWHIRDINEQQKAFQNLQQSEETNRLIMNSAMDAIVCMDMNGNLNFWSKQAERIFGWSAEEVVSKPMTEVIMPKEFKIMHERGMERYLQTGEQRVLNRLVEVPALHKDGHQFPAELTIIHVKTETQNFFCAFIRDVTERKMAVDVLKASEERYRSLFENMALGVLEVDNEEQIVYANKSMLDISGYSLEELMGKNAKELFLRNKKAASVQIHTKQNKIRVEKKSSVYELEVTKKDNTSANWVISGAPVFDIKGNIKGSVGIHWDVTKIKQMETDLLNEKLEKEKAIMEASLQVEEEQRSLIGRDLHDGVGQMLAYINLYINMLKYKGTYGPDELTELQKTVGTTLEQVRTLSRNLAPPSIRDLGLRDAVIELIQSYSILKEPVINLSIYAASEEKKIKMDKKTVLYRVIQELINNTLKYAKAGTIEIKFLIKNKTITLQYKDNGKGFDPEKVKKGVGLNSISSRIRFHKGSMELTSAPGAGTFIVVTMPI